MQKEQIIPITNGHGSIEIIDGTYNVSSTISGYNDVSIIPSELTITLETNNYSLTVAALGTLTLYVSDDGTDTGLPIEGATFIRCDADGNTYGEEIISNSDGDAIFNYVPFAAENAPIVYYKQTSSDGNHTFDTGLRNTTLLTQTHTEIIENPSAPTRSFSVTDTNYSGLPIEDGQITLLKQ